MLIHKVSKNKFDSGGLTHLIFANHNSVKPVNYRFPNGLRVLLFLLNYVLVQI